MMKQFFNNEFEEQRRIVKEGDVLNLGNHKLSFIGASMVHWPEVIMTYDLTSKVLFSADGFGKFGIDKSTNNWEEEARRYYFGIVGKYGLQVKQVLNKINNLDINIICPLHGPILKENLNYYLSLYDIWSSYKYEEDSVLIVYCSIYGNSKKAVNELEAMLVSRGQKVIIYDLTRDDMSKAISDAFKSSKLILVSSTYNMDIFPSMNTFIHGLIERNYQNRVVGFIENGSWMPNATKVMKNLLSNSKNLTYLNVEVRILSSLDELSRKELMLLVEELLKY
jgi:flavorubredoxin